MVRSESRRGLRGGAQEDTAAAAAGSAGGGRQKKQMSRLDNFKANFALLWDAKPYHRVFVYLVLLQAVLVMLQRMVVLKVVLDLKVADAVDTQEAIFFFGAVFISIIFVVYFAVHAVLFANAFELGAFVVATFMLLVRLVFERAANDSECKEAPGWCLANIIVNTVLTCTQWAFIVKMYGDLKWKKYKAIGADVQTRDMYRLFEMFQAVRKVDIQFSLIVLFTGFVFFTPGEDSVALVLVIALTVVEYIWERMGNEAVKKERPDMALGFQLLSLLLPAFIIYVGVDWATAASSPDKSHLLTELHDHNSVLYKIGFMGSFAFCNRVCTMIIMGLLQRQMGTAGYKGLRRLFAGSMKERFKEAAAKRTKAASKHIAISMTAAAGTEGVEVYNTGAGNRDMQTADWDGGDPKSSKSKRKKHKHKHKHKHKRKHKRGEGSTDSKGEDADVNTVNPVVSRLQDGDARPSSPGGASVQL